MVKSIADAFKGMNDGGSKKHSHHKKEKKPEHEEDKKEKKVEHDEDKKEKKVVQEEVPTSDKNDEKAEKEDKPV